MLTTLAGKVSIPSRWLVQYDMTFDKVPIYVTGPVAEDDALSSALALKIMGIWMAGKDKDENDGMKSEQRYFSVLM